MSLPVILRRLVLVATIPLGLATATAVAAPPEGWSIGPCGIARDKNPGDGTYQILLDTGRTATSPTWGVGSQPNIWHQRNCWDYVIHLGAEPCECYTPDEDEDCVSDVAAPSDCRPRGICTAEQGLGLVGCRSIGGGWVELALRIDYHVPSEADADIYLGARPVGMLVLDEIWIRLTDTGDGLNCTDTKIRVPYGRSHVQVTIAPSIAIGARPEGFIDGGETENYVVNVNFTGSGPEAILSAEGQPDTHQGATCP